MKVAVVVQRYGEEVIGGAETLARQVAEKLAAESDWQVHAITTTARDYQTWENHYAEGWTELGGVRVCRFDSRRRRSRIFSSINASLASGLLALQRIGLPAPVLLKLERAWLNLQGPVNPKLSRYIADNLKNYDRFIFFTYLYLPTIRGIEITGERSILVPAAHDEKPFYFLTISRTLEQTGHILANSVPERELLLSRGVPPEKVSIAGMGIEGVEPLAPLEAATDERPYVLYLGRISAGKQVDRLVGLFERFRRQAGFEDMRLLLAGQMEEGFTLPEQPWLEYLGYLDEDRKTALIAGAACVINPSSLESMSLIVVEAMALGRPVLVNSESPILGYYVDSVDTVFGYGDEDSFIESLSHILSQDWRDDANAKALEESRRWVIDAYSWERVLAEYRSAIGGEDAVSQRGLPG